MDFRKTLGLWRYLIYIFIAALTTISGVLLVTHMEVFGVRIPSPNVSIDYLKGLIWSLALLVAIQFIPIPSPHKKILSTIWILKIFVTMGLMLVYEQHYILDAYTYYKESVDPYQMHSFSFFDGTLFVSWLGATVNNYLPFTNSYHALKVLWAFAGLFAVYIFFLAFKKIKPESDNSFFIFLALFPSVIFWTSILGKDPLTFLGISLFTLGVVYVDKKEWKSGFTFILTSLVLLALVRFWVVPLLIIAFSSYSVLSSHKPLSQRLLLFSLLSLFAFFALNWMFDYLNIYSINEFIHRINYFSRSWAEHGTSGQAPPTFYSTRDLFMFLPVGAFTALFRPLPGEINNIFGILAGLENIFVLGLFLYTLINIKRIIRNYPIAIFFLGFLILWSVFYGFISYQNLGTAFRFRLQVLPILLIMYSLARDKTTKQQNLSVA